MSSKDKTPEDNKRDTVLNVVKDQVKKASKTTDVDELERQQIIDAQAEAIEQIGKEKLTQYALKVQAAFGKKWFTLVKFQHKFKLPKAASAQVLLALFAQELLAMENKNNVMHYKIDFTTDTQLDVIERTLARHRKAIDDLEKEKSRLLEIRDEREANAKKLTESLPKEDQKEKPKAKSRAKNKRRNS